MARDIGEGYHLVTERTFKKMSRGEIDLLAQEIDHALRDVRGEQPASEDLAAVQLRNRRIQRLNTALLVLRNYQAKSRRG